jgi:SagB-type dehydrogenase family enzyme
MIVQMMKRLRRVKPYTDYPKITLPETVAASKKTFDEVLRGRQTAREFGDGSIHLHELAKVLFMSYGLTRDNSGTHFPRPFRIVPSGGALYPLEVYVHASRVERLEPGLYHYDPEDHALDILRRGDESRTIARSLVQTDLALNCAAVAFISAIFVRSTFKYGDRGYRFVLLEAGHLAQNAILTATDLGLAAAPIGGYMDREVDDYLGIDGLNESTVYILLIGQPRNGTSELDEQRVR